MEKKARKQRKQGWYSSNGQGEQDMATHGRNGLRYWPDIRQVEDQARQIQSAKGVY